MKKLLFAIALSALPFVAHAQPTNVQIRVTWDGVNSSLNLDSTGSKKDQNRIAGLWFAYQVYVAAQGTNTVLAPQVWLRNQHTVLIDDYSAQKQASDSAIKAEKIKLLMTVYSDLLDNAQKNQLDAIAALLP